MKREEFHQWKEVLNGMITSNNILGAISTILNRNKDKELGTELMLLKSIYTDRKKMIGLGLITQEEWQKSNNQLSYKLLKVVSDLDENLISSKSEKDKESDIPIDKAISWLSSFIKAVGHIQITKEEDHTETELYTYPVCEIDQEKGTFKILESCKNWIENDEGFWEKTEEEIIEGKLSDISEVYVESENKEENENADTFTVHVFAHCRDRLFIKIDKSNGEETTSRHFVFHLYVRDLTSAERIKNALDYISYYFGREEEVF